MSAFYTCIARQAWARLQNWYKKLRRYDTRQYEISVSLMQYRTGDSWKSTNLNSIARSFFMKIWMKTVINWDFLNCNRFKLTNWHNSEIINFRHNLDFSPISQRNTWFHISFISVSQNIISIFHQFHWEILSFILFSQNIISIFHRFHWEILGFMSFQWVNTNTNGTMGLKRSETDKRMIHFDIFLK